MFLKVFFTNNFFIFNNFCVWFGIITYAEKSRIFLYEIFTFNSFYTDLRRRCKNTLKGEEMKVPNNLSLLQFHRKILFKKFDQNLLDDMSIITIKLIEMMKISGKLFLLTNTPVRTVVIWNSFLLKKRFNINQKQNMPLLKYVCEHHKSF